MIYQINKYHRTELGETSSSEKIENVNAEEAYRKACSKFYEYAHNYMEDKSVIAWTMEIIQPSDMTQKKHDGYTRPVAEAEEVAE